LSKCNKNVEKSARGIEPLFELFLMGCGCVAKKASGESPALPDRGRTRPNYQVLKTHLIYEAKKTPQQINAEAFNFIVLSFYSAKTITLFFKTSTTPPLMVKVCVPALSVIFTLPAFKALIIGAWLFSIPKEPSLPGNETDLISPSNNFLSGLIISKNMLFYFMI
jgi:hypothetical protein